MIPQSETDRRKQEAIRYMDRVIDTMALSDTDMKAVVRRNAKKLIDQAFVYKNLGASFYFSANEDLDERISVIVDKLQKEIFNIIYTRCNETDILAHRKEETQKSDKYLLLFLSSVIAGYTLQDRINLYIRQFRNEIEAYIAIGISKGMTSAQILNYYLAWMKKPYESPLIFEAIRKHGYNINKGIITQKNKYKSAFNNLVRLQQDSTMRTYNHTINAIWLGNQNIVGWYTVRGSSYPCAICDDNVGIFHPKDEFFYGWHPRCCCIMLPVYITDII